MRAAVLSLAIALAGAPLPAVAPSYAAPDAPRTWRVGPDRELATPSAAAAVAGDERARRVVATLARGISLAVQVLVVTGAEVVVSVSLSPAAAASPTAVAAAAASPTPAATAFPETPALPESPRVLSASSTPGDPGVPTPPTAPRQAPDA